MEHKRRKRLSYYTAPLSLRLLVGLSGQSTLFPFYHCVNCKPPSHIRHLYPVRSEKEFASDMEYLLKHFEPLSMEDYLAGRSEGKRRMVLSFDDGLVECHQFIAPFLKQKGIPAVFFLNNDFIDNRGLFYRYRASLLIDHLDTDKCHVTRASEYLEIPEDQIREAILMVNYKQGPLLDTLAMKLGLDEAAYLKERPVYMSTEQVNDLLDWGFQVGAHGMDHAEFTSLERKQMEGAVGKSVRNIQARFKGGSPYFAFPFSSDGVSSEVIDQILEEGVAKVLMGTSGLKRTGRKGFIQRIPMETLRLNAQRTIKAEYLYYLLKAPFGRNHYFTGAR